MVSGCCHGRKIRRFWRWRNQTTLRRGVLKLTSFIIIELLPIARANYYYIRLIVVNYYNVNVTDFLKRAVFSLSGRGLKEFPVLTVKSCGRDIYSSSLGTSIRVHIHTLWGTQWNSIKGCHLFFYVFAKKSLLPLLAGPSYYGVLINHNVWMTTKQNPISQEILQTNRIHLDFDRDQNWTFFTKVVYGWLPPSFP